MALPLRAMKPALLGAASRPRAACVARPGFVRPSRTSKLAVSAFKITLKTPDGVKEIECDEDTYILDAAEEAGIDLPYSCRGGACSSCCAKVEAGTLDQSDQSFLDEEQMNEGFALICVSYPKSDVTLVTHQESALT